MTDTMTIELSNDHKPKTLDELDHSRLFDVHRVSDHHGFRNIFDTLWEDYFINHFPTGGRGNKPKKTEGTVQSAVARSICRLENRSNLINSL